MEVFAGCSDKEWDWVGKTDAGLTVKIREGHANERVVLLLPSAVHESLEPAKPQGLYIRDQRDAPVWGELADILVRGVGKGRGW